jgi:hypothetical protein
MEAPHPMDRAAIFSFLSHHRYAVIASLSKDNTPQSALIGIAISPELEIIFDTVKSSRKYPNLISNPQCSLVIGWQNEITVQFEGLALEPTGHQLNHYQQIYFAVWPECRSHLTWPGITHVVVRPTWLRYSDFNQNPPQIEEMAF